MKVNKIFKTKQTSKQTSPNSSYLCDTTRGGQSMSEQPRRKEGTPTLIEEKLQEKGALEPAQRLSIPPAQMQCWRHHWVASECSPLDPENPIWRFFLANSPVYLCMLASDLLSLFLTQSFSLVRTSTFSSEVISALKVYFLSVKALIYSWFDTRFLRGLGLYYLLQLASLPYLLPRVEGEYSPQGSLSFTLCFQQPGQE